MTYLFFLAVGAVTGNLWEETVWGGFVQGRLMARHGLLVGSLLTAVPFFLIHLPLAFENQRLAGHQLAGRLPHLGCAAGRGTVPALPDRHPARRHRRQHPRRRSDACLHQRGRRDGDRPGGWQIVPALILLTLGVAGYRSWRGLSATDGYAPAITPASEAAERNGSGGDAMTAVLPAQVAQVGATHRPATTVLLHLVPGAVALLGYVGLVPLAAALGLPSVAALAGVGLLVVPAVQLGILQLHHRRRPSEPAVALRARLPLPRVLGWAVLEIVLAGCRVRSHGTADPAAPDPDVRVVAADRGPSGSAPTASTPTGPSWSPPCCSCSAR